MNSSSRGESSLNVDSSALIACSGAATAAVEQVFFFFESWYRQWCISWEAPRLSAFCIDSKYRSLVTPANIRGGNSSERVLRQWFGPQTHFKLKSILCVCHQNLTTTAYTVLLKAQMWLWRITRTHIYDQGWNNTDLICQTRPRHFYQPRVLTENTQAISSSCKLWRCLRIKGSTLLLDTHWSFRAAKPAD